MEKKASDDMIADLKRVFVAIDNEDFCEKFFKDIFTPSEIEQLAQRLRAAKLLLSGHTYAQIMSTIDVSCATLSRVNSCIRRGEGGYAEAIKKLDK